MSDRRASRRLATLLLPGAVLAGSLGVLVAWTSAQRTPERAASPVEALDSPTGFAVRLNFSGADQLLQLSDGGRFLVHGLTADAGRVKSAREAIRAADLEGIVSVERGDPARLPYSENLVNLLIVDEFPKLSGVSLAGLLRVVAPQGTLWLGVGDDRAARERITAEANRQNLGEIEWVERAEPGGPGGPGGVWGKIVKPRADGMGVWSQRRYDASGTAVSDERELEVPTGVRWIAGPNWATHLRYSAVQGVTASERRLVYFFDEEVPHERADAVRTKLDRTPTGRLRQHSLVARDAFNGLLLWKRWIEGTPSSSLLITRDDRIYTQLDEREPLLGLDPQTGETVRTYQHIDRPREVLFDAGRLIAATRSNGLVAVDPDSGDVLWRHDADASNLLAGDGKVFFQTTRRNRDGARVSAVESLDLAAGRPLWHAALDGFEEGRSLRMVLYRDGVLVFGGSQATHAASAEDGRHLWSYEYPRIGHGGSYSKVLYFDGLVWVHPAESDGREQYAWEGLDPKTGKIEKRFTQPQDFKLTHRCYEDRASGRQILCGTMDFVDIESGEYQHFAAARHSCRDGGVLPANGMLYTFPHSCHCYPMLRGFLGLATKPERAPDTREALERGPAFGQASVSRRAATPATPAAAAASAGDWPTLRGNASRSASTTANGPEQLALSWERTIAGTPQGPTVSEWSYKEAGRLSSPVVADGTVFVAVVDAHRLEAMDASTGQTRWSFVADGRIDAPPTIHQGLCLFGSRDGRVYCLRASDGELVWRLRAAPHDERIVAYGQLESTWPVVGGVLVHEGVAFFAAGRHSHGDGGVHVSAVDPPTGKVLWQTQPQGFLGLADLLIARGDRLHMIDWEFDLRTGAHRKSESEAEYLRAGRLGLVSDSWYEHPIALRKSRQQWSVAGEAGQNLIFDDERLFGFLAGQEQTREFSRGIAPLEGEAALFGKRIRDRRGTHAWQLTFPPGSQVRAMGLSGDRLYFAGRLEGYDSDHYVAHVVSTEDGSVIDSIQLPAEPVHDGLAIASGRLYVSLQDGRVLSLGGR